VGRGNGEGTRDDAEDELLEEDKVDARVDERDGAAAVLASFWHGGVV
jgi:hypothetical protein